MSFADRGMVWALRFFIGALLFSFMQVSIGCLPAGAHMTWGRRSCLLAEIAGGAAFVGCAARFGEGAGICLISLRGALFFIYLGILFFLAWIDQRERVICDGFHIGIALLGLTAVYLCPETGILSRLAGIFAVSLPMLFLAAAIPGAFGGGDIKLMAASGLLLGWRPVVCAMAAAVLAGGVYGVYRVAVWRSPIRESLAFGPFLALGLGMAVFWGDRIAGWLL